MRRVFLSLVLAACASAPAPKSTAAQPQPQAAPRFEFHSRFWVNLHERLYTDSGPRARPRPAPPSTVWSAAVELYRARFPDRGIEGLFAAELVTLRAALAAAEDAPTLDGKGIDPELAAALQTAAPEYRAGDWPRDDAQNRAWVAALEPRLAAHQEALIPALERAYRVSWQRAPIVVDVSATAGPVGAFTSLEPTHISVASADPRYAGDAALEMIFHEASHALVAAIDKGLAAAAAAQERPVPPRLWHALLFFTTGEIVARRIPGYVPYATANGLYTRSPEMGAYERAMRAEWLPYLDGKIDFDAALAAVLRALAGAASG